MSLKDALTGKTAQEIEAIAGYVLTGLETIAGITGSADLAEAGTVLSDVKSVVDVIITGVQTGVIDASQVTARIAPLEKTIADDNAAADAAAAEKFKTKTP